MSSGVNLELLCLPVPIASCIKVTQIPRLSSSPSGDQLHLIPFLCSSCIGWCIAIASSGKHQQLSARSRRITRLQAAPTQDASIRQRLVRLCHGGVCVRCCPRPCSLCACSVRSCLQVWCELINRTHQRKRPSGCCRHIGHHHELLDPRAKHLEWVCYESKRSHVTVR